MSRILLRWSGGEGGDTIMSLVAKQKDLFTNVDSQQRVSEGGQSLVSTRFDAEYPLLREMATHYKVSDKNKLINELERLCKGHQNIFIKSHLWDKDIDNAMTGKIEILNIGFSIAFIPFIVKSNLLKTPTMVVSGDPIHTHFDQNSMKLTKRLPYDQKKKFVMWNLIKDAIDRHDEYDLANASIRTEDLFYNIEGIKNVLQPKGLPVKVNKTYINTWRNKNKELLPGSEFLELIKKRDYDHSITSMDLVERYVLLALSGKNFQFIHE